MGFRDIYCNSMGAMVLNSPSAHVPLLAFFTFLVRFSCSWSNAQVPGYVRGMYSCVLCRVVESDLRALKGAP